MSAHVEIKRQLAVYRNLGAQARQAVDAHIARCVTCEAQKTAYDRMDSVLAAMDDPAPPPRLSAAMTAILNDEIGGTERERGVGGRLVLRRALLPATLALLVIVLVWLVIQANTPAKHGIAETPSLTASATPVALASPGRWRASNPMDVAALLATRYPAHSRAEARLFVTFAAAPRSRTLPNPSELTPAAATRVVDLSGHGAAYP